MPKDEFKLPPAVLRTFPETHSSFTPVTGEWDNLAKLIQHQPAANLDAENAAGLIKMCIFARTAFGFRVAASKLSEVKFELQIQVKSLLMKSLDDLF